MRDYVLEHLDSQGEDAVLRRLGFTRDAFYRLQRAEARLLVDKEKLEKLENDVVLLEGWLASCRANVRALQSKNEGLRLQLESAQAWNTRLHTALAFYCGTSNRSQ